MGQSHPSTPAERVQWTRHMLAHSGEYGLVTQLSRTLGVSRPTLSAWKATAQQALEQAFRATPPATRVPTPVERHIVTLLVEGHTSSTNIQTCLARLTGQPISIGTIAAVAQEAQRRAPVDDHPCARQSTHPGAGRNLALQDLPDNKTAFTASERPGRVLPVFDQINGESLVAHGFVTR